MKMDNELMSDGIDYMKIVGGFVFLQAIVNTFSAILRAHGKTKTCMIVTIIMNVLNIGLNYVLIFGFGPIPSLGVAGAAISTTFSKFVAVIILGAVVFKTVVKEFKAKYLLAINRYEIRKILTIGIPSAGETISYNLACLVITRIINDMGKTVVTANSYISTITNYNYLFALAIAQGTAIMIGWKIGAGKRRRHINFVCVPLEKA